MANGQEKGFVFEVIVPQSMQKSAMQKLALGSKNRKLVLNLRHNDFKLSWMEFFERENRALYNELQSSKETFRIMDGRVKEQRKIWRLNATVKDYINSFSRALRKYRAEIVVENSKLKRKGQFATPISSPQQSTSRAANSNACRTNSSPGLTSNRDHSVNGQHSNAGAGPQASGSGQTQTRMTGMGRIQCSRPVVLDIDPDDSASMADSMLSQDSQVEDLLQLGVEIEEIKSRVCTRLAKQVDNNTMLRIQHELQQLVNAGNFMRVTRHMPQTSTMLNLIFNLQDQ